jgi:Holliday junction DNA helicase RuvA
MISSLTGTLKSLRSGSLVVEVGGVGLLVNVPARLSSGFTVGTIISLQTVLVVREDALTLYGFETHADREIFELLQTVTGIGPKVAQSALNIYETPELVSAIKNEQAEILEKIPGLGKKGAQRVVLELREKVDNFEAGENVLLGSWRDQLTSALIGLGFTARDTQERIEQLSGQFKDVANEPIGELLRAALSSGVQR